MYPTLTLARIRPGCYLTILNGEDAGIVERHECDTYGDGNRLVHHKGWRYVLPSQMAERRDGQPLMLPLPTRRDAIDALVRRVTGA